MREHADGGGYPRILHLLTTHKGRMQRVPHREYRMKGERPVSTGWLARVVFSIQYSVFSVQYANRPGFDRIRRRRPCGLPRDPIGLMDGFRQPMPVKEPARNPDRIHRAAVVV